MYKIILNIKNKQFLVSLGTSIKIDRLPKNIGDDINFESVMMIIDEKNLKTFFGNPFIKGFYVKAEVIEHIRDSKIRIIKFKRRKHYKLNKAHRQNLTIIKIKNIYFNNKGLYGT